MNTIKECLTTYLTDIRFVRGSGKATDERSYYPALTNLLGHVGAELTPRVKALRDVKDRGVGHPDFLLEVETTGDTRAAVEVKGTTPDVDSCRGHLGCPSSYNLPLIGHSSPLLKDSPYDVTAPPGSPLVGLAPSRGKS